MKERIRFVFLSALLLILFIRASEGKRRASISDDLADVVDEEEDEQWKEWGKSTAKKKSSTVDFDPPPNYHFSKLNLDEKQNDMLKRHVGPTFGFIKLRLPADSISRSPDDVSEIASRWSKLLRTASIEITLMAVDLNTIMFTMKKGENTLELKDFILNQEDAYEVKIGDHLFRRHGDPPLDEVIEMRRKKTTAAVDEL